MIIRSIIQTLLYITIRILYVVNNFYDDNLIYLYKRKRKRNQLCFSLDSYICTDIQYFFRNIIYIRLLYFLIVVIHKPIVCKITNNLFLT